MKAIHLKVLGLSLAAILSSTAWGQGAGSSGQQQPQAKPPQQQPSANQPKPGQAATPGSPATPDTSKPVAPAATAEEDAAYRTLMEKKTNDAADVARRIQLGEDFLKKYPESRYVPSVYSAMTLNYLMAGDTAKMMDAGGKALQKNPDDILVLALLGQTIPRAWNPSQPDAQKQLDTAEKYAKRVIELTPALVKPEGQSDEDFTMANKQRLAMAHSGLGLVYFRRGKFPEAVPELEESTKLITEPDPVNYYLLGMSLQKTSHYDNAVAAFTKCAEIEGPLQAGCKDGLAQAKKSTATQLSAPK